jgi:AcrR family transcriptional regulator
VPRPANPVAHEALLEAARAEFARRGLGPARVEDIARRAGVSKGAFYLHFRTKEDVFKEILQRFIGALEEHAKRQKEAMEMIEAKIDSLTAEDVAARSPRFEQVLEMECSCDVELLELFWRNRQIIAALDGASGKWYWQLVNGLRRRMMGMVAGHVIAARSSGRIRADIDPDFVADLFVGSYEAFLRRMISMSEKPDLARWSWNLASLVHEGLYQRPSDSSPTAGRNRSADKNDRPVTNRRDRP